MPPGVQSASTSLAITNPLVLYRTLLATRRIDPDPAQHRLAIHLQKIYHRLLDYEPEIQYNDRIKQLSRAVGPSASSPQNEEDGLPSGQSHPKGVLAAFRARKEAAEALALTRKLTDHQAAIQLRSPQGLLLYGEVGTGKSMLIVGLTWTTFSFIVMCIKYGISELCLKDILKLDLPAGLISRLPT